MKGMGEQKIAAVGSDVHERDGQVVTHLMHN
jgi:hypothetical protein